jgi:VCBS repeat-containing protein
MLAANLRLRLALLLALGLLVGVLPQAASADLDGNEPPVAVDDEINTAKGTPGDTNVLVNDSDPDDDPLTIVSWTQAANGTVVCAVVPTDCTYTPNDLGFFGSDSFTYTVSDGNGGTDVGTVAVTITATNEQPVAVDDFLTLDEDTSGNVDVLANDTDDDGDPLVVESLAPEAGHGTVSCTPEGICTYTPEPDFAGSDTFTYTISDPQGGADSGDVFVTVTQVNDPPHAVDDTLVMTEDELGSLNVRLNDTDVDGDTLLVTTPTPPAAHGTVSCLGGGGCSYQPDLDYVGPDSFDYTVSDGHGGTDTGHVSITVQPEDLPPVADDETLTTAEDLAGSVNVLAGDTDPDGDSLSVTTAAPTAAHGTVSCQPAGSCTYTPAADYNGSDSFEYSVGDGRGKFDTGLVTVTVTPVNDAPDAAADSLTAAEDLQGETDVLANDTDVEGDALAVTGSTNGAHGTVSCDPDGTCAYTPAANFAGSDSFTYTVSDGAATDTASVTVTVTPGNDAPVADDDSLTVTLDTSGNVDVLAGDVDVDGDALAVEADSWSDPDHGSVSCETTGVCTYTPDSGYLGADSFTYAVTDGEATDEGLVSVTVQAPDVAPSCGAVKPSKTKLWPPQHQLVVISLSGATDPDGDPLAYTITGVTQDEKVAKVAGKGDKKPDAQRVSGHPNQIRLRAERDPKANGRIYRILYRVSDGRGGTCTGVEKVGVPIKSAKKAVETGKTYNSFG